MQFHWKLNSLFSSLAYTFYFLKLFKSTSFELSRSKKLVPVSVKPLHTLLQKSLIFVVVKLWEPKVTIEENITSIECQELAVVWGNTGCAKPDAFPTTLRLHTWAKLQFCIAQPFCLFRLRQITLPSNVNDAKTVRVEGGLKLWCFVST